MNGKSANNQMHRTATPRCGFRGVGMIGYWIRGERPFPVAVGNLGRHHHIL